ncbi:MAG TPA: glycosidase [Thermotogota bacterium]|nr:glycosidase [Thermotogota bacterium]HPJ88338.1 glycosidase [Thermotogota bacterium]HPR95494.1 glycosidase [Thermotogota bacterium]
MRIELKRSPLNPLFAPNPMHLWESKYVFNPAVVYDGELFHMLYRAQGADMVSRMGYAVSTDGLHFNRMEKPVFSPERPEELYGVEDPRLTRIEDRYYMTYTAYSPTDIKVALASTKNFITWERHGIILPEYDPDKDAVLFPEKINGKYVMLHRDPPNIWIACSDDLIHWQDHKIVAKPIDNEWENEKIGAGGPPVKTPYGWLLCYHAVQKHAPHPARLTYRLGFMLLDADDPSKVLKRTEKPILEPKEDWEIFGGVPQVVFTDALVEYKDQYYVHYGAADNYIALATIDKREVFDWINE